MQFKFSTDEKLIALRLITAVAYTKDLNRASRRRILALAKKFTPNAETVFIKPTQVVFAISVVRGAEKVLSDLLDKPEMEQEKKDKVVTDLNLIKGMKEKMERRMEHELRAL